MSPNSKLQSIWLSILSWYRIDYPEGAIKGSLEMFIAEEEVLLLTSILLAGVCSFEESISMWFETDMVGNAKVTKLDIVEG